MINAEMNMEELVKKCMGAVTEQMKNLQKLNIVVVGKTGVGKSTLINNVFREKLVETGIGRPITQHMNCVTKDGFPLRLYDTKGFELGGDAQREVQSELIGLIKKGDESGDINQAIHCIWYCVSVANNRFEEQEEAWIKSYTEESKKNALNVPVIIVLTQAFSKENAQRMKKDIEARNLDVIKVVPVLAEDYPIDGEYCKKAYGMDVLIEVMQNALPKEIVDTLMHVQQVNIKLKQKKAQMAVTSAVTAAVGIAAVPIPFSDAVLLVPTEITMLASITTIFGLDISKAVLTTLVSSVIGAGGATFAGKTLVSNLLKMIPGVGTLTGAAISASTAALLTTALGEAYIAVMTAICNGEISQKDLETESGKQKISELFKRELKKKRIKEKKN